MLAAGAAGGGDAVPVGGGSAAGPAGAHALPDVRRRVRSGPEQNRRLLGLQPGQWLLVGPPPTHCLMSTRLQYER